MSEASNLHEGDGFALLEGVWQEDLPRLLAAWSTPLVMVDASGRVRAWNRGAAVLYGRSEREAVGTPWKHLAGEDPLLDPPLVPGTRTRRYETVHRAGDGRLIPVMVTRTELLGPSGVAEGSVYLVVDLTEAKALEERLKRRMAQLSVVREISAALQSAMELDETLRTILVGATAGQGLRFNRAFLLLVDPERRELAGRLAIGPSGPEEAYRIWARLARSNASLKHLLRVYEPVIEDQDSRVTEIVRSLQAPLSGEGPFLARAVLGGKTVRVSDGVERESGRAVEPEVLDRLAVRSFVAVPLTAEGTPVGLLLADNAITGRPIEDEDVEDLELLGMQAALAIERARLTGELETQVRALEKAGRELQANQERLLQAERLSTIGQMAARVAHEIRNPLVAIGGFARSLLRTPPEEPERREALEIIVDEVRRLETIVREVLDFTKPVPPRFQPIDLSRVAGEVLSLLRWEMEQARVSPDLQFEEGCPPARADRDRVFQALVNIVRNAIHAMPEGGTLAIRIRRAGERVELAVTDTGTGMPPEVRARIFDPFFTTKSSGSGLGLTVASQIVREHGGELEARSEVGQGTTVFVRLPVAREESHDG